MIDIPSSLGVTLPDLFLIATSYRAPLSVSMMARVPFDFDEPSLQYLA
jgi:hypothetical protein